MARVLIVAGGARGRELARELGEEGHAARITTRREDGRAAIEAVGAQCWIGTPDRIGSLRYALDGVTLLCWLLGTVNGEREAIEPLHGSRLELMLSQAIDTTVRGIVYEGAGTVDPAILQSGAALVRERTELNRIPARVLESDPADSDAWLAEARGAIGELLSAI